MQKSNLHGLAVFYEDQREFHSLKNEIFTQHTYYVEIENPQPVIIDAGAHIGLATLYFKKMFPGARVIAIEPHPANLKVLDLNVFENRLEEVTIVAGALVGTKEADGNQVVLHGDIGHEWLSTTSVHKGAWTGDQQTQKLRVKSYELSQFLTEPVDVLKMDIEGAEQEVLSAAKDQLPMINHLFVEFHPHPEQSLEKVVSLLENAGFRLTFSKKGKPVRQAEATGLVIIEGVRAV
ncbi:MAG TPA: FkbM family methyltransferase [Patescibacteria group bacterium]